MKEGFHQVELNRTVWVVPKRYDNLDFIGSGTYGCVCKAQDIYSVDQNGHPLTVAIKKFSRPFQSVEHAKRAYREVMILKHMRHEYILTLLDLFTPNQEREHFDELYFVSPYAGNDLHFFVNLKKQSLTPKHVEVIVYQMLSALKYIHSAGLIHRDLKPSNIGVSLDSDVKILDFGMARQIDDKMTDYVVTRWWRAPEIVLKWMPYDQKADLWSIGCIMVECIERNPLFTGKDDIEQLDVILRLLGSPSKEFLAKIDSSAAVFLRERYQHYDGVPFKQRFPSLNDIAIDFLQKLLVLDPDLRMSAEQALEHPYLESLHDPNDEPTRDKITVDLESERSIHEWKDLFWSELSSFDRSPSVESQKGCVGKLKSCLCS